MLGTFTKVDAYELYFQKSKRWPTIWDLFASQDYLDLLREG
jgi:hypothetical protein